MIELDFGGTTVKGTLNDSEAAKAFADALPITVRVSPSGMDFCGQLGRTLPYDESKVGYGWKEGDINYNPGGGWLAIFYGGEDVSSSYGDQLNIGRLEEGAVDILRGLNGTYDLTIKEVE